MFSNQILTRVLVHDPNPLLAGTICKVLEQSGPFTTMASHGNLVDGSQTFRPNVIVLDPDHLAVAPDVLRGQIARHLPHCEVLAYVDVGQSGLALKCIAAGFVGAVSQSRGIEVLIEALNTAKLGGIYVDSCFAANGPATGGVHVEGRPPEPEPLSPRERHVLEQVARGFSNKEIAGRLGLSPKTVETHRARASVKLNLRRKSDIVQYALQNCWLSDPTYAM